MQLKKEVKLLKTENEQLRQIVIDFSGTGTGLPPSRTPTGSRFPALPSPSVKANNHHQSYFPPADQNAAHGPNDSSELSHTKQLLAKFIDENQEIKNQNVYFYSLLLEKVLTSYRWSSSLDVINWYGRITN